MAWPRYRARRARRTDAAPTAGRCHRGRRRQEREGPSSLNDNSAVQRNTLIDFFRDLAGIHGEFLVYDDGYRRRGHSYEDVGRAARGFAAKLAAAGFTKGDKVVFWGEN